VRGYSTGDCLIGRYGGATGARNCGAIVLEAGSIQLGDAQQLCARSLAYFGLGSYTGFYSYYSIEEFCAKKLDVPLQAVIRIAARDSLCYAINQCLGVFIRCFEYWFRSRGRLLCQEFPEVIVVVLIHKHRGRGRRIYRLQLS
jgi:hypothetical protein